jgi:hypothetical protein
MNNPYDVHSWSKLYREEALREARKRHLADSARAARRRLSGRSSVVSLGRACWGGWVGYGPRSSRSPIREEAR